MEYGITTPQKEIQEIICKLENKVEWVTEKADFKGAYFYKALIQNVRYCILNEKLNLQEDDFDFRIYTIIRNEKSKIYYDEVNNEDIYVIFETHTGYIASNCNRLFLELYLERGINIEEIKADTVQSRAYLFYLEQYDQLLNLRNEKNDAEI